MNSTVETQNELRVKVAELCGARWFTAPASTIGASAWPNRVLSFKKPNFDRAPMPVAGPSGDAFWHDIPDYPNDLNACHEFEKLLTEEQAQRYESILGDPTVFCGNDYAAQDYVFHATAEQRCRAFVATMEASSVREGTENQPVDPSSPQMSDEKRDLCGNVTEGGS